MNQIAPRVQRHVVLIDAENLSGSGAPDAVDAAHVQQQLSGVIDDWETAFVIVGCSHIAARNVFFQYPRARNLWQSGDNGADLALLSVLEGEGIDYRFARITICSGDGIFAEPLARLVQVGLQATVISRCGHLSWRLRRAAHRVIELPPCPVASEMRVA